MLGFIVMLGASATILVGCVAVSGERDECPDQGGCVSSNDQAVPNVVGQTPREACRTLEARDYGGVIRTPGTADGTADGAAGTRVVAQDPEPGVKGGHQQGVRLTVSGPVPEDALSSAPNCLPADRP